MADVSDMLRTYLQDHHAGSTVGLELARRAAGSNEDTEYGTELARIADEIAEDRVTLEQVMDRLGVKASAIKDAAGWTAEKFGRLKHNNSLFSYSPLSRVVELEGLVIGVTGKLALWESLRTAVGESLDGIEFAALSERAADQRSRLEALRKRAAAEAFQAG
ncbi:MAG TPA: hypothetical protein VID76_05320 [Solirubrobacterales bacterium]